MDARTFDGIARRLGGAHSRRQALRAAGLGLLAAAVGRGAGSVAAQDVDAERTCRLRLERCNKDNDCCEDADGNKVFCKKVSNDCNRDHLNGKRCCGKKHATCADDCDCCSGHVCSDKNKCRKR